MADCPECKKMDTAEAKRTLAAKRQKGGDALRGELPVFTDEPAFKSEHERERYRTRRAKHLLGHWPPPSDYGISELFGEGMNADFVAHLHRQLDALGRDYSAAPVEAVKAIRPLDGIEAMLAVQMAAMHDATMRMLSLVAKETNLENAELFSNMANKASRTFAALAETLIRKRSGGQQQIVVQHIHITADKAAVAVDGQPRKVTGGTDENGSLSHDQAQQATHAPLASLRSTEQERQAVPVPSDAERPLLPSRRAKSRITEGKSGLQFRSRPVDKRGRR